MVSSSEPGDRYGPDRESVHSVGDPTAILRSTAASEFLHVPAPQDVDWWPDYSGSAHCSRLVRDYPPLPADAMDCYELRRCALVHGARSCVVLVKAPPDAGWKLRFGRSVARTARRLIWGKCLLQTATCFMQITGCLLEMPPVVQTVLIQHCRDHRRAGARRDSLPKKRLGGAFEPRAYQTRRARLLFGQTASRTALAQWHLLWEVLRNQPTSVSSRLS